MKHTNDDRRRRPVRRVALWTVSIIILSLLSYCFFQSLSWGHKAVSDVRQAEKIAGGFSDDDRRLYARGVLHIRNRHERIGQFTIVEVIEAERSREQAAADARDAATQRAAEARQKRDEAAADLRQRDADAALARRKAASDRAIVADEKQGITAVFDIVRDSDPTVGAAFKDWSVDENATLQITVDADYWDELSQQDKDRVGRVLAYSWKKVYGHVNHDPDPSVYVQFTDLAGNAVDQYR